MLVYYLDTYLPGAPGSLAWIDLFNNLMGSLPPQVVSNRLPENHGIGRDLLHAAITNLVVFAQKISTMVSAGDNRHHLAIGIFGGPLNGQFGDGKPPLSRG